MYSVMKSNVITLISNTRTQKLFIDKETSDKTGNRRGNFKRMFVFAKALN